MHRQCARAGCSDPAAATFTFDTDYLTVWLDTPSDGGARAGDLCTRHARALVAPRGWQIEDRRSAAAPRVATAAPTAPEVHPAAPTPEPVALVADPQPVALVAATEPASRTRSDSEPGRSWEPRFDPDDDLDGLLDARGPLLGRAFRNIRAN